MTYTLVQPGLKSACSACPSSLVCLSAVHNANEFRYCPMCQCARVASTGAFLGRCMVLEMKYRDLCRVVEDKFVKGLDSYAYIAEITAADFARFEPGYRTTINAAAHHLSTDGYFVLRLSWVTLSVCPACASEWLEALYPEPEAPPQERYRKVFR